jgi:antitoxin component of RelBE/YafQ-DinJ toxin-antitoxin module
MINLVMVYNLVVECNEFIENSIIPFKETTKKTLYEEMVEENEKKNQEEIKKKEEEELKKKYERQKHEVFTFILTFD